MRKRTERDYEIRGEKRRRRQRELRHKIAGFCLFTFLLGVLCGKIVFAKDGEDSRIVSRGMHGEKKAVGKEGVISLGMAAAELADEEKDSWNLVLVNHTHPMEEGYVPQLAEIENNYYFDARAVEYLKEMLADGRKEGLDFWICSAYRTIEKQTQLYEKKVRSFVASGLGYDEACEKAAAMVAYPGTSEHNLGLAVDIVAKDYQLLDDRQADTPEAKWLKENCWKYGFILRYPTDKTEITGIIFEPWHYRYVGKEAAREITEQGICLEEYL